MQFCWFPLIEDDFGQERFLTEDPSVTFQSGNFNRVPVIIGRTEFEFSDEKGLHSFSAWVQVDTRVFL
jgi:hypothetical protein